MSRKTWYTAEEVAEIIVNLPHDNSIDTDIEDDLDESDADFDVEIDNLPPLESEIEASEVESSSESEYEESSQSSSSSEEDQPQQPPEPNIDNNLRDNTQPEDTEIPPMPRFEVNQQRLWRKREKQETDHSFDLPQGPILDHFSDCTNEGDYFLKFINAEIRERILYETNLYINQKHRRVPTVTDNELYSFLGINLLMGYHNLPSLRNYWSSEQDLNVPLVSNTMSRNRFQQILTNLHLNDNNAIPEDNTDKLYKLRPFIDGLNNNFMMLYNISENVSIDESMILFKGRNSLKQYNPMKPIKRGYKIWARADMDGYMSKFSIYQGKNGETERVDAPNCFGLGEKVVLYHTNDLFGKNHKVYFDNYFSSVPLAEYLLMNKVFCCGTIRQNRKYLPSNLKSDKELTRGEFDYRVSNHDIAVFKWMDNKAVNLISNFHGSEREEIRRKQKDGSKKTFSCPKAINDYNKNMGGVDKADFYCAIYGLNRKNVKWWHRLFFGLIDRALTNAYVAYCKVTGRKIPSLQFRRNVTLALITLGRPPKVGRPSSLSSPLVSKKRRKSNFSVTDSIRLQNRGVHWVEFGDKRSRCEVCSKNKIEARPYSFCHTCKVNLCCQKGKNCFAVFHDL